VFNAHRINQGIFPIFPKEAADFFIFQEDDPEKAADRVVELASKRISDRFGYSSERDIQVLSPLHRGVTGVTELNERLQTILNPSVPGKIEIRHGSRSFRVGDRVMQLRNDYERQVFNGDMGTIKSIDLEEQILLVEIDDKLVQYDWSLLDDLIHAYAISIHKSQGSEYPVVITPILPQHFRMLQRNLLYTAVTRARKLVVLVGTRQAVQIAVKNNHISIRNTRFKERLISEIIELGENHDHPNLYGDLQ
ncbi:ATP-dependent RecD-like DNA helicase, partial [bacterium]|nr:ATP-dependent RecD-like DNA helicase [bacterium]